ncbi:unnamed protein product [Rangifer tarandus platyrhynchus]|uniref:Uncharacterized protein n=2 Tax=Rangifer tarandus platyrhynchus TaxID=3082113 RepID=A0ACB0E059_RANTA|nr:unnamed protein product [Rangifer tarandus platyrhynchus]CAI9693753.1 unnamed protein product [Rangifer tarandus platyrhynchus]
MSLLNRRAHKATAGCRALKDENTVLKKKRFRLRKGGLKGGRRRGRGKGRAARRAPPLPEDRRPHGAEQRKEALAAAAPGGRGRAAGAYLGLRGFPRGSVCPGRPPPRWPDRRDAGWPMSHGGGGPPELLPGQVRSRRRRKAGAGSFWREHEPGWDRGPGRGPRPVAARAGSVHRGGVGGRRA